MTAPNITSRKILYALLGNPSKITLLANSDEASQTAILAPLFQELKQIFDEDFTNALSGVDLSELVAEGKKLADPNFIEDIFARVTELDPRTLSRALRSSNLAKLFAVTRGMEGDILPSRQLDPISAMRGEVVVRTFSDSFAQLNGRHLARAVQGTDLVALIDSIAYYNTSLAQSTARNLLALEPSDFALAAQNTGLSKFCDYLLIQLHISATNDVVGKLSHLEIAEFTRLMASSHVDEILNMVLIPENEISSDALLAKLNQLDGDQLAQALQGTNINKLLARLEQFNKIQLAKNLLTKLADLNPGQYGLAMTSTELKLAMDAWEYGLDDEVVAVHHAWDRDDPVAFLMAQRELNITPANQKGRVNALAQELVAGTQPRPGIYDDQVRIHW